MKLLVYTAICLHLICSSVLAQSVGGIEIAPSPVTMHPWQEPIKHDSAEVYFTNLVDGAKIETPHLITFGLSGGWGLASIASAVPGKSGHHHLLVNRGLPMDFTKALPFNDQYIHFGKGQMETVLTLAPGNYDLRLLLADDKHLPRFVYSRSIKITVTKKNMDIDPKNLIKKGISFLNLTQDAKLTSPFKIAFHASGLNVAHLSQKLKDTGHFRLTLTPKAGGKPTGMSFTKGQTEVWLAPPKGAYTVTLDLMDNANLGNTLTGSTTLPITVQ